MIAIGPNDSLDEHGQATRDKVPFVGPRMLVLGLIAIAIVAIFGGRIYYLTVFQGTHFREVSENNFLREAPIKAPRGRILASDGSPVSLNKRLYQLQMSRFRLGSEEIDATVQKVARLLDKPDLGRKAEDVKRSPYSWRPVTLARNLDSAQIAAVLERQYELPGIQVEAKYLRHYPQGAEMGHITGYVGLVSEKAIEASLEQGYLRDDRVGKINAERTFEENLRGVHGSELVVLDATGRSRQRYVQRTAERGNDVTLTIVPRFQSLADRLLLGHSGAIVVMNPKTGAVWALSAKPDFDPNHPTRGFGTGLHSSYNKVTRTGYAPGSTFKLITATAGLRAGFDPEDKINCPGRFYLSRVRRPFFCDVRYGHGPLNLVQAIQRSCNVFFYTWSNKLGAEKMVETASDYGFGKPTGFDLILPGKETGATLAKPGIDTIYRGSIVQMGIGQGSMIDVTPLQLAVAYSALANNGVRFRPYILHEIRSPDGELLDRQLPSISGELTPPVPHWDKLLEGLRRVVALRGGTGYRKGFKPEWKVAGKTGSSEVAGQKLTNGLFAAFAPHDDPQICVVAIVEAEGHGGSTALPMVVQIMSEYFEPGSTDQLDPENEPPAVVLPPDPAQPTVGAFIPAAL